MKEIETLNGNVLIHHFLGWQFDKDENSINYYHAKYNGVLQWSGSGQEIKMAYEALQYHKDWNLLMGVVEKIESLGYLFTMDRIAADTRCYFNKASNFLEVGNGARDENKIAATWLCVIDFIKNYHNELLRLEKLSNQNKG